MNDPLVTDLRAALDEFVVQKRTELASVAESLKRVSIAGPVTRVPPPLLSTADVDHVEQNTPSLTVDSANSDPAARLNALKVRLSQQLAQQES